MLNGEELMEVYKSVHDNVGEAKDLPQGPTRALSAGLRFFNWNLNSPFGITTGIGVALDLRLGSPAIIRKFVVEVE